jgi:hypothetical protein
MRRVVKIPPSAHSAWNRAYNVHLEQWTEGMYFEKSCEKIKKAWLNAFYNPSFVICIKRLNKEFEELRY